MLLHHAPGLGLLLVLEFITPIPASPRVLSIVMSPCIPQTPRVPGRFLRDHPRKQSRGQWEGPGAPPLLQLVTVFCISYVDSLCKIFFLQQFVRKNFKHTGKVKEWYSEPHHLESTIQRRLWTSGYLPLMSYYAYHYLEFNVYLWYVLGKIYIQL